MVSFYLQALYELKLTQLARENDQQQKLILEIFEMKKEGIIVINEKSGQSDIESSASAAAEQVMYVNSVTKNLFSATDDV